MRMQIPGSLLLITYACYYYLDYSYDKCNLICCLTTLTNKMYTNNTNNVTNKNAMHQSRYGMWVLYVNNYASNYYTLYVFIW